MTARGRLRRVGPDLWLVELDQPGRPAIGEVVRRPDGFVILMLGDADDNVPLSAVKGGPFDTMVEVRSAIATALHGRGRVGAY